MAEVQPIPTSKRFKDLTGQEFERLTVRAYLGKAGCSTLWLCDCKCGKTIEARSSNLKRMSPEEAIRLPVKRIS